MKLTRRFCMISGAIAALLLVAAIVCPIRNSITRGAIPLFALIVIAAILHLGWRYRIARYTLLVIIAFPLIFLCIPGKETDTPSLRAAYIRNLRSYEGTRYVWGGETRIGIDCSGLMRAAMFDALVDESAARFNPALARHAIWLWFNDASAHAMGEGRGGVELVLPKSATIASLPPGTLEPGDMATIADGSHVIAYLGDHKWIEADPGPMRVIMWDESARAEWMNVPLTFVRWKILNRH